MSAKYPSLQLRKADRLRDVAQYNNSLSSTVASLSQCTLELTQLTLRSVERLYRAGFAIKKAGIVLSELETEASAPRRLWQDDEKRQALMRVMDALNNGEHKARGLA